MRPKSAWRTRPWRGWQGPSRRSEGARPRCTQCPPGEETLPQWASWREAAREPAAPPADGARRGRTRAPSPHDYVRRLTRDLKVLGRRRTPPPERAWDSDADLHAALPGSDPGTFARITRASPPDSPPWCWAKNSASATYRAVVATLHRELGLDPCDLTPQLLRSRADDLGAKVLEWLAAHPGRADAIWHAVRASGDYDGPTPSSWDGYVDSHWDRVDAYTLLALASLPIRRIHIY